ncbi:hypothetical protein Pcinc_007636 [Petrolisthes cinctipes]|uniref:Carbohydrate sulfotransferase n=1 Tax=Petrolisthes cinctipes TaxID=88211 RepID=A0AAE1G8X6_PETCI|nr:hypothetical protein Pcinc_007636 [Petrolisthes cinctipes]
MLTIFLLHNLPYVNRSDVKSLKRRVEISGVDLQVVSEVSPISVKNVTSKIDVEREEITHHKNIQRRMEERAVTLRTACQENPPLKFPKHKPSIIVLEDYNVTACVVLKVGASTFTSLLVEILRDTELKKAKKSYLIITKYAPSPKRFQELLKSTKFQQILFVRDPLQRLLSAYNNRIKNQNAYNAQATRYGPDVLKTIRKLKLPNEDYFHPNKTLKIVPTFSEFIEYLTLKKPTFYDQHWKPITLVCSICQINYTHVIRMETFTEDLLTLMWMTGMDQKTHKTHLKRHANRSPVDTSQILVENYSKLKPEVLSKIIHIYKYDFILLGYDPSELLNQISPHVEIKWRD